MIKKFEEFVNEGLLDVFKGDGCESLETICKAFAKRLSSMRPIKFKWKSLDGRIIEQTLDYSKKLYMEFISAEDDLVINYSGKRTIKEEAKRIAHLHDKNSKSPWGDEDRIYKQLTKFLYKSDDLNADKDYLNKEIAMFTFTIPYLVPVKDENDVYELKTYYFKTGEWIKTHGKDDKEIATNILNKAFYRLYKGLTDPDDKIDEFKESSDDISIKDIRKYVPSELINVIKKATKRGDLNK
jgi:hypothetical protein